MPPSHWTSHPVAYKHLRPEGASVQQCMDTRSSRWKAAPGNDHNPLPPETSGRKNATPGGSCDWQHGQELPPAPLGQVSCCWGKWQGLYFHTQLLPYDLVSTKLWRFPWLPNTDLFRTPAEGRGGCVLWLREKGPRGRCSQQTRLREGVVWGMAWGTVSLSKARLCNPVGQLSWEPQRLFLFGIALEKQLLRF